jgi:hypothetical protein
MTGAATRPSIVSDSLIIPIRAQVSPPRCLACSACLAGVEDSGQVARGLRLAGAGPERLSGRREGPACSEELVHDQGAGGDDRPQFAAVDDLGGPGGGVPGQAGDLLDADPRWLIRLTKEVRSSRGVQSSPIPAAAHTRLNIFRTFSASCGVPELGHWS